MMKKILAVAIASAFAAPAFAATANVDIYGTASVSVDYVDGGSGGTPSVTGQASESRARVSSNTSIIGFKGSEDLGGGLSAIWQIENQVAFDTSGAFGGARETFAGLSSKSLGSLTLGLRDTAYKVSTGKLDVFGGGNTLADYRSLFGGVTNGSIRASNSVTYISPSFSGLTVRGTTAAMQENGSSRNPHLYSVSGTYENGPLFVTLAHEDIKFAAGGPAVANMFGAGGQSISAAAASSAEAKQKNTRLGAGYSFGDLRIGAAWERTKIDVTALTGTLSPNASFGTTAAQSTDRDAWYLSGAYKLGNTTLKAAYTKAGDLDGLNDSGAKQFSLGADYSLSKRTTLYALFTQVKNETNASYTLGGNPTNASGVATSTGFQSVGGTGVSEVAVTAAGQDPRGVSIGMIHKF